jgi:hypothetical protein
MVIVGSKPKRLSSLAISKLNTLLCIVTIIILPLLGTCFNEIEFYMRLRPNIVYTYNKKP